MSDFIRLTKITVAWDRQEPMTNVFAVKPANIISLTETEINNIKCTEIEAACNNGVIRYFVKESVNEILRKIDPSDYTDLDKFIFNTPTPALYKICETCKYNDCSPDDEPCYSCDYDHENNWKPKEDSK